MKFDFSITANRLMCVCVCIGWQEGYA